MAGCRRALGASDVVSAVGNCAEVSMADRASTWIDLAQSRLLLTRDLFEGIDDGSWHEGFSIRNMR